jgi:hypothetical protein
MKCHMPLCQEKADYKVRFIDNHNAVYFICSLHRDRCIECWQSADRKFTIRPIYTGMGIL